MIYVTNFVGRRPISEAIKVLVDSAQHNSSVRLLRETLTKSSNTLEKLLLSLVIDTLETSHLAAKASRDEDPAWFEGLSANFKTKEAVLRESAKRRLRGYLRTVHCTLFILRLQLHLNKK